MASASATASRFSRRRTATCPFERRVRVTEAFAGTVLALVARRAATLTALTADIDRATAHAGAQGTLGALGTRGRLTPLDRRRPDPGRRRRDETTSENRQANDGDEGERRAAGADAGLRGVCAHRPVPGAAGLPDSHRRHPRGPGRASCRRCWPGTASRWSVLRASLGRGRGGDARRHHAQRAGLPGTPRGETGRCEASRRTLQAPAGSLRVSMGQRLARLIFHLLEPTSDDGVVTWNLRTNG